MRINWLGGKKYAGRIKRDIGFHFNNRYPNYYYSVVSYFDYNVSKEINFNLNRCKII